MRTYAVNRSGAFTGPARLAPIKVTRFTLCTRCNHPRGDHRNRAACEHTDGPFACDCTAFVAPAPPPKRRPQRTYTAEEVETWRADLMAGFTYRETSRRRKAPEAAIRHRVPGFKGNSHNPARDW